MTNKRAVALGALVGFITGLPLIGVSYFGDRILGLPYIPFTLFDWLARALPGNLVTLGIDTMVDAIRIVNSGNVSDLAKPVEQFVAVATVIIFCTVAGSVVGLLHKRSPWDAKPLGAAAGLVLFFVMAVAYSSLGSSGNLFLTLFWLLLLTVGWGLFAGTYVSRLLSATAVDDEQAGTDPERRRVLRQLALGSAGLAAGSAGVGWFLGMRSEDAAAATGAGQPLAGATPAPAAGATLTPTPNLSGRLEPAPGTRAELTSNDDFYRIDINTRPEMIDGESWELEVGGLFDRPRNLTIDDLMAFPTVVQPITLSCISNRVAGDLIGTSNWSGVRLRDVLADLQINQDAGALYLEGSDGFFEVVSKEDMMDDRTLLVFGMNGETLPVEHGFPLRIYIPNRYGMKQPKWIVRMEAIEEWMPGYWVERGWSREARPRIVSVIDTIATDAADTGAIPVGGIAWAGDRGIQKVEVQVDDGEWMEAELRLPPRSTLTWVQWRYDWEATPGRHTLTVRATDGTGALQIEESSDVRPDGATGYHSERVSIAS